MATAQAITWRERLSAYYYLCRFDKPIGTELVFLAYHVGAVDCSSGHATY